MPRRKAKVNQADFQRIIRAYQRENVPFRVTLQPDGAAIFESPNKSTSEQSPYDKWKSENGQG
jgi:hypothetical protein